MYVSILIVNYSVSLFCFALQTALCSSFLLSNFFYTNPFLCRSLLWIRLNNETTPIGAAYSQRKRLSAYWCIRFIVSNTITPKSKMNCWASEVTKTLNVLLDNQVLEILLNLYSLRSLNIYISILLYTYIPMVYEQHKFGWNFFAVIFNSQDYCNYGDFKNCKIVPKST